MFERVSALVNSCFSLGIIVGPLVAVIVYKTLGLQWIFYLNGLSFIFSGFWEKRIKSLEIQLAKKSFKKEKIKIIKILKKDKLILGMLFNFFLMNLCLAPLMVFLPVYTKELLGGDIDLLAILEMSFGIGAICGALLCSFYKMNTVLWVRIFCNLLLMG